MSADAPLGIMSRVSYYGTVWIRKGMSFVWRGAREGRRSLIVLGCSMVLGFLLTRRRGGKVAEVRLDPGDGVTLRVR